MLDLPYDELYELSISKPEIVWNEIAQKVVWHKPYTSVIDDKHSSIPNWFVGGEINMSYNCLDRAIEEGHGNDVAIIYESPVTNTSKKITYKQLLHSVELLAGVMVEKCGIVKGDRVLFYLPVIPQCLIAMLACTRIGAIYSIVYGGFPPKPISARIQHIEPRLIITCNVGYHGGQEVNYKSNIDEAIAIGPFVPDYCIVYNRPNTKHGQMIEGRDLDWDTEIKKARPQGPIPMESSHPILIIYTSGTTGEPKGLVFNTANFVVINAIHMKYFLNVKPGEVWWMFSEFPWITGQTNMSYGCLLNRSVSIIYEGEYNISEESFEILSKIKQHGVVSWYLTPSIMRLFKNNYREQLMAMEYPDLRCIYLGGETSSSSLKNWISEVFQCAVYDLWGQTEMMGPAMSPGLAFGRKPNSSSIPFLGFMFKTVDMTTGDECAVGNVGRIVMKLPSNPSFCSTLYKNHEGFLRTYFKKYPGFFDTMDCGKIMPDGSLEISFRADDDIQVYALRISGAEIAEACLKNSDLSNACVVPLDDPICGQVPFAFLVKKRTTKSTDSDIIKATIEAVEENVGSYVEFKNAIIVPELPISRNFKTSKYSLADMINNKSYKIPSTVINPHVYKVIFDLLIQHGYRAVLPMD